jgi:hypothetical protein
LRLPVLDVADKNVGRLAVEYLKGTTFTATNIGEMCRRVGNSV